MDSFTIIIGLDSLVGTVLAFREANRAKSNCKFTQMLYAISHTGYSLNFSS
jgi:hypothetical protein